MKMKYLIGTVAVGIVLLSSNNVKKSTSPLEETVQTIPIKKSINIGRAPENQPRIPYSEPEKNPNDYDPISNMKAILEPEDRIYDEKKVFT